MSRPFSYSDENFTVIGNVLFCHIKIKNRILKGEPIVEIPQEIYDHMLFTTQRFNKLNTYVNINSVSTVDVGVGLSAENKKYFLYTNVDIYEKSLYLFGIYMLKDI